MPRHITRTNAWVTCDQLNNWNCIWFKWKRRPHCFVICRKLRLDIFFATSRRLEFSCSRELWCQFAYRNVMKKGRYWKASTGEIQLIVGNLSIKFFNPKITTMKFGCAKRNSQHNEKIAIDKFSAANGARVHQLCHDVYSFGKFRLKLLADFATHFRANTFRVNHSRRSRILTIACDQHGHCRARFVSAICISPTDQISSH